MITTFSNAIKRSNVLTPAPLGKKRRDQCAFNVAVDRKPGNCVRANPESLGRQPENLILQSNHPLTGNPHVQRPANPAFLAHVASVITIEFRFENERIADAADFVNEIKIFFKDQRVAPMPPPCRKISVTMQRAPKDFFLKLVRGALVKCTKAFPERRWPISPFIVHWLG